MRRGTLVLIAVLLVLVGAAAGCGSSQSPQAQALDLLAQADQAEQAANYGEALSLARESMALSPSVDAALLQAAMEYALDDVSGARATLALCPALDPSRGEDDLLAAYIESDQGGSCSAILGYLDEARRASYAGMGCSAFWDVVETTDEPWFAYFRNSCGAEFATLVGRKTTCAPPGAPAATCNRLAWVTGKATDELWINHFGVTIIDNTAAAADLMGSMIPNVYAKLVLKIIRLEALRIRARDHGCGVVLHWVRGQIVIRPEFFVVSSQGS